MSGRLTAVLWVWGTLGFLVMFCVLIVTLETRLSKKDARLALFIMFGGLFAPITLPLGVVYLLARGVRQLIAVAHKADLPELLPPVLRGNKETDGGQLSVSRTQGGELSSPKREEP